MVPLLFTLVGWCIIFFISDRSSRRAESRADFGEISKILGELREDCCSIVLKDSENEGNEIEFDLFELESASKISRVERLTRSLTQRLHLKSQLISTVELASLRGLMLLDNRDDLYAIYEACEDFEERLQTTYHSLYYQNFLYKYNIEILTTLIYVGALAAFFILF